jgi:hypothetical protein
MDTTPMFTYYTTDVHTTARIIIQAHKEVDAALQDGDVTPCYYCGGLGDIPAEYNGAGICPACMGNGYIRWTLQPEPYHTEELYADVPDID